MPRLMVGHVSIGSPFHCIVPVRRTLRTDVDLTVHFLVDGDFAPHDPANSWGWLLVHAGDVSRVAVFLLVLLYFLTYSSSRLLGQAVLQYDLLSTTWYYAASSLHSKLVAAFYDSKSSRVTVSLALSP